MSEWRPTATGILLLEILMRGPGYVRQLRARIRQHSGDRFDVLPGSAYPAIERLLDEGMLVESEGPQQQGRPRRWYAITPLGRAEAEADRAAILALLLTERTDDEHRDTTA